MAKDANARIESGIPLENGNRTIDRTVVNADQLGHQRLLEHRFDDRPKRRLLVVNGHDNGQTRCRVFSGQSDRSV